MCYKIRFLEKLALGRETNFDNSDDVIKQCIQKGYIAMLKGGRFHKVKKSIVKDFANLLEKHNYQFSNDLLKQTTDIFLKICAKKYAFGLAQKIVNSTFKYFFTFKKYINVKIDFTKCHCPLDSVVLNKIGKKISWISISYNTYDECQKIIANELKKKNIPKELKKAGNLAFDFIVW